MALENTDLFLVQKEAEGTKKVTFAVLKSAIEAGDGPGPGGVTSVNGKVGDVVLDAADVDALPDTYTPPVTSVNSKTGDITLTASDVGALPDTYTPPAAPVTSVNSKTGVVVLSASDVGALPDDTAVGELNVQSDWNESNNLSDSFIKNKPSIPVVDYPVTSVNSKTGDVTLTAADVGALPDDTVIPTPPTVGNATLKLLTHDSDEIGTFTANATSDVNLTIPFPSGALQSGDDVSSLINDAGYLTSADVTYPVTSVNGKTGAVSLTASDVGALDSSYTAPVSSVNGKTGVVVLSAADTGAIPLNDWSSIPSLPE